MKYKLKTVYEIYTAPEYDKWLEEQTLKSQLQIDDRLSKILVEGHFGTRKLLDKEYELWELKWENGRRVYFAYIAQLKLLILLGGNKNGQDKDIAQARKIFKKNAKRKESELRKYEVKKTRLRS